MDYQQLLCRLKVVLQQRLPAGESHARLLSKILDIQPHSVYRKLNGDIQFSVDDLMKISGALAVPLGSLMDDYACVYSHPMELILIENMTNEQGYKFATETAHDIFEQAGKAVNSKFTAVCKNLPVISYYYYDWLMKFAHLKWLFFNNGFADVAPLSELNYLDEYKQVKDIYLESFNSIRRLIFIIDGNIVRNFIQDLVFSGR
ncbi:MAG: hypothetical protein LIP01_11830 [Tannerellaceae bacterium]|nr:hypothetical protein [Tannerellaceae bacterium]